MANNDKSYHVPEGNEVWESDEIIAGEKEPAASDEASAFVEIVKGTNESGVEWKDYETFNERKTDSE